MLIQHQQDEGIKASFLLKKTGHVLAEMTYANPAADRMIIQHTRWMMHCRDKM